MLMEFSNHIYCYIKDDTMTTFDEDYVWIH